MDERRLRGFIRAIRNGRQAPRSLVEALRRLPFEDVGVARVDTHRRLRRGLPEIILGQGKTVPQLTRIAQRLRRSGELVVITRLDPDAFQRLHETVPTLRYEPAARLAYEPPRTRPRLHGLVLVVTGGTSDAPVAEEAALTLRLLGSRAATLYDVGVAGVHRVLSEWRLLRRSRVIIVIAGMDGALASVVAGLVACPVIAVPTSVGYGANFQGLAPLLTMLNSCAPGIGVVNIDNGFGAAYLAHLINRPA